MRRRGKDIDVPIVRATVQKLCIRSGSPSKITDGGDFYMQLISCGAQRTSTRFLGLASWLIVSSLEGSCGDY